MAVAVREINGVELEQLIAEGKVLADFYSKVCGPCKMLSFVLNDVAKNVDNVEIVKLDFDENKETVEKYGVVGYPTLILFNNGQEVERLKGLQQKPIIQRMIER
ncbi:thioredoxin domain-containing protein [Desulfosporosinus nitroreducens]|uniref:Thioredoxin n=1 Tax=Desulfosporosinus nitroreducens TaxID=2018668 RepID=A0ABT8QM16_9FIRM|nr:thioredoxin domain-containing protein [Desulfosporosinus nitroreducens]MCO1600697.1 thioredoxin domain-containing protein [Desulfosporosinus nitroreducens]MDO0822341.1 thioredoxin domain-containing protein [Desulfosporosinus nitroreducens]